MQNIYYSYYTYKLRNYLHKGTQLTLPLYKASLCISLFIKCHILLQHRNFYSRVIQAENTPIIVVIACIIIDYMQYY